jgi:hypothetical protein
VTEHVGITIVERGAAVVTVDRSEDDELLVTGIERMAFNLDLVAARARDLDDGERRFMVDGDGVGSALYSVVGGDKRWTLFQGRGIERQSLVDELLVVVAERRLRFAPGLAEQEAMNKALVSYRRQVRDDGLIGSELVTALCLAIRPPVAALKPFAIYAGPRDEVDGTNVNGRVIRRTPDGGLVAIQLPPPTPTQPDDAA